MLLKRNSCEQYFSETQPAESRTWSNSHVSKIAGKKPEKAEVCPKKIEVSEIHEEVIFMCKRSFGVENWPPPIKGKAAGWIEEFLFRNHSIC